MGEFKAFLESDTSGWGTVWRPMQVRRIGTVKKKGSSNPLFWDYHLGEYIVGSPKDDKFPLTFYSPEEIASKKVYDTLEALTDDGYELSRLGFVRGPFPI